MDARRLLSPAAAALCLATSALAQAAPSRLEAPGAPHSASRATTTMDPIPNPPDPRAGPPAAPRSQGPSQAASGGRAAIAAANLSARQRSRPDRFVGGLQLFSYAPGRVYEVWTAPLRVTTLTLGPGESLTAVAAGDTVRWQIGETTSGQGAGRRTHVLVKPLERRLETNLVLTTNQRLYDLHLRSGEAAAFNTAVAWDADAHETPGPGPAPAAAADLAGPAPWDIAGLDAGYEILPRGRRPAWAPNAVMTDGVRTFIAFPPQMAARPAPALFVIGPDGEAQMVNYRQQGGLFVVDRVIESAELRLGDRRAQVVGIARLKGDRP